MKLAGQFFSFCVVGTVGFVVDLGTLYAVSPWLGWHGGRAVSFLAAASATWWLNRRFTFGGAVLQEQERMGAAREYLRYLASMLGGALVNYGAYAVVLRYMDSDLAPLCGVAAGSIAGLAVNFLSARFFVFRKKAQQLR
jgi:putative flippase GtrA